MSNPTLVGCVECGTGVRPQYAHWVVSMVLSEFTPDGVEVFVEVEEPVCSWCWEAQDED